LGEQGFNDDEWVGMRGESGGLGVIEGRFVEEKG
jgi:hypothetical protein